MASSTTNYSFSLPEVGGDTDQWGSQLNSNWTLADTTLKTIADSVGDDVTLTGNDYLTISGQVITVGSVDLTADVTGTLPVSSGGIGLSSLGTANQVLAVNAGATALEFQNAGSGTVTSVAVSGSDGIEIDSGSPVTTSGTIALGINATTLSTHLGLGSLATQSSVTESQISDLQTYLTASSTATLTNKSGAISQWTNDSGYLTAETNNLSTVSGTLGTANGGTGLTTIGSANQVLAVNSGATALEFQTISVTESQISDFGTYQAADAGLTSIAGLTTVADRMIYTTAADTYAVATLTSAGRALLDDADAAAQRTTLGLGSLATQDANSVTLTGGSLTGTEIDLKSSGTTIYASDGTTAVLSESAGTVTLTVDEANVGSNALVVDSSGNVGIGTDTVEIGDLQISNGLNIDRKNVAGNPRVYFGHDNFAASTSNFIQVDRNTESMSFQVNDSTRMLIDSSGHMLVGTNAEVYGNEATTHIKQSNTSSGNNACLALQNMNASGSTGVRTVVFLNSSGSINGTISNTSSATAYNIGSDYRLKENITEITDGITRVKQLNPSRFNFVIDPNNTVDGFIAHEVSDIVPEAITGEKDAVDDDGNPEYQGIDQSKLVPLLTAALQESIALIESQQSQIDALTARIEALEAAP